MKIDRDRLINGNLAELFKKAPRFAISDTSKYIIFSDLHLGNGSKRKDDFLRNSKMFLNALEEYYFPKGFFLILNGDVEELQKFRAHTIANMWKKFYEIADKFNRDNRLLKIIGNHEIDISFLPKTQINKSIEQAAVLLYNDRPLFVFHGHQAAQFFSKYSRFISFFLRFFAAPLGIKNRTASHDSKRKYQVERRAYFFSSENKIVSILGHTHRPLFESFSRFDSLRYGIEQLLREYPKAGELEKISIQNKIHEFRKELEIMSIKDKDFTNSYYHEYLIYPCLFNSGCVIGKRGMTGIEIIGNEISLVHWYDIERKKKSWKEIESALILSERYHKRILKSDNLEYIFNRINLLAD